MIYASWSSSWKELNQTNPNSIICHTRPHHGSTLEGRQWKFEELSQRGQNSAVRKCQTATNHPWNGAWCCQRHVLFGGAQGTYREECKNSLLSWNRFEKRGETIYGDYVVYALLQPDILHRCLSAEHVLVSKNGVCKLTGFGFAEHIREREEYERKKEVRHYYSIMYLINCHAKTRNVLSALDWTAGSLDGPWAVEV